MEGSKLDSIYIPMALPYESSNYRSFTDPEINDLRYTGDAFTAGSSANGYVTPGGQLQIRPEFRAAVTAAGSILTGRRIDRLWFYETFPTAATGVTYGYVLISAFYHFGSVWEMYYYPLGGGVPVLFTNIRSINNSAAPHTVAVSRGLAYVKGSPTAASGEKLGGIIFDGSNGTPVFRLWGMLGPTAPVHITGWVGKLTAAVTDAATSMTVSALTAPPATPFPMQIEYEEMTVTAKAGAGPYTLTVTRGVNGSTKAAHTINTPVLFRDWAPAAHKVNVSLGWTYAISYVSVTEQISNRSDIERNPDLLPSNTGPFADLIPKITFSGLADTTNFPFINVYRTTDGGGTFFKLEQIPNTGAGTITYEDKSLGTGAASTTFADPVPDTKLDTSDVAPSLTSNSPPPTVNPPQVVGVDTPNVNASPMATYSSRIWYGINNLLYYSGDEEVKSGVPEECWPSGVRGNFFRFVSSIITVQATSRALYILTSGGTFILTGTNQETFTVRQISSHTPMLNGAFKSPTAATSFLDRIAFLTSDGRVVVITDDTVDVISEPIIQIQNPDFVPSLVTMAFVVQRGVQWLAILDSNRLDTPNYSGMYLYDWQRSLNERRDFWLLPWKVRLSSIVSFQFGRDAFFMGSADFQENGPLNRETGLVTADFATSDLADSYFNGTGAWITERYTLQARIGPLKNTVGNHVNVHGLPQMTTTFTNVRADYKYSGISSSLGLSVFYDNDSSAGVSITTYQTAPTRRAQSTGYITKTWHLYTVGQDFGLLLNSASLDAGAWIRIDRMMAGTCPDAGPDGGG